MSMQSDGSKRCSQCRETLPLDAFAVRTASADGRQHLCRACAAKYARRTRPRKRAVAPTVPPSSKWCRRCEVVKDLEDFPAHHATRDKRQTYCRDCFADIYRQRREQDGHVTRPADVPPGHKFCRGCQQVKPLSEWTKREKSTDGYHFRCRECISRRDRERHLAITYGLSKEDVAELLARQNGVCIICLRAPAVHVDHDHSTGEVRGMLCFRCNVAIGHLDDDPSRLRRAGDYLEGRKVMLRAMHPGVVEITYTGPQQPTQPPQPLGPSRPPVDVGALRAMALRG